jgi:hypothetical protein
LVSRRVACLRNLQKRASASRVGAHTRALWQNLRSDARHGPRAGN